MLSGRVALLFSLLSVFEVLHHPFASLGFFFDTAGVHLLVSRAEASVSAESPLREQ